MSIGLFELLVKRVLLKKEHLSFETTYHPLLGKNGTIRHIFGASDYSFKLQSDELLAIKS